MHCLNAHQKYIPTFCSLANNEKFILIMSNSDPNIDTALVCFITKSVKRKKFMKRNTKMRVQGTTCTWKEQMPLPNIHLNKGKYPQSGIKRTFNILVPYLI